MTVTALLYIGMGIGAGFCVAGAVAAAILGRSAKLRAHEAHVPGGVTEAEPGLYDEPAADEPTSERRSARPEGTEWLNAAATSYERAAALRGQLPTDHFRLADIVEAWS